MFCSQSSSLIPNIQRRGVHPRSASLQGPQSASARTTTSARLSRTTPSSAAPPAGSPIRPRARTDSTAESAIRIDTSGTSVGTAARAFKAPRPSMANARVCGCVSCAR